MTIGALEDPPSEVFGRIDDVAIASDGSIAILDGEGATVSLFDSMGRFRLRLGGPGDGPSELRNPLSLILLDDDEVLVGELTRTWKAFRLDSLESTEPRLVRLDVSPRGICVMSDGVAVHGVIPEEEPVVWVYSSEGESIGTFGAKVQGANDLMRVTNSYGLIGCSEAGDQLLYAPAAADSTVRSFRADGTSTWTATIPGYLSPIVTATENGYTVEAPDTGWHSLVSLFPWTSNTFIVQVAFHTLESREREARWESLETYRLDAETGVIAPVSRDVPELRAVRDEWVVGVEELPFPHVVVWRR